MTFMEYDFHNQKIDADRFAIIFGYRGVSNDIVKQNDTKKPVKYDIKPPVQKQPQIINHIETKKEPILLSSKDINSITIKKADITEAEKDTIPIKLGTTPTQKKNSTAATISTSSTSDKFSQNSTEQSSQNSIEGSFLTSSDLTSEKKTGEKYIPRYVSDNMDALAIEISCGNGETLETLSHLLKIEDKEKFYKKLQKAFTKIYDDKDVTSSEVYHRIVALK